MTINQNLEKQFEAARNVMDRYHDALAALAGNPVSSELERKMEAARKRMERYSAAYRAFADGEPHS